MQNVLLTTLSVDTLERLIYENVEKALSRQQPPTQLAQVPDPSFTIAELAEYLKVTKATIFAYKKRGVFPYYQTGRTVFFKKSEVDKAMSNKRGR